MSWVYLVFQRKKNCIHFKTKMFKSKWNKLHKLRNLIPSYFCFKNCAKQVCTQTHTYIFKKKVPRVNGVDLWVEELMVILIFFFTLSLLSQFSIMKINTSKERFKKCRKRLICYLPWSIVAYEMGYVGKMFQASHCGTMLHCTANFVTVCPDHLKENKGL